MRGSEGVCRGVRMEGEVWQVANEGGESGEGEKPQPRGEIWAVESNKYLRSNDSTCPPAKYT